MNAKITNEKMVYMAEIFGTMCPRKRVEVSSKTMDALRREYPDIDLWNKTVQFYDEVTVDVTRGKKKRSCKFQENLSKPIKVIRLAECGG